MTNSFISSFSEENQDKLKKSMLECSILFSMNRNKSLSIVRNNMLLQTVFAIVTSEDHPWSTDDIVEIYKQKFKKIVDPSLVQNAIDQLVKSEWLFPQDGKFIPHEKIAQLMNQEIRNIEECTKQLFLDIISNVKEQIGRELSEKENETIQINIKNTFNLYVRLYGFDAFAYNAPLDNLDVINDDDIINAAILNLDEEVGTALLEALSNLIEKPTDEQGKILMQWVKTFIGMQIMRLDPLVSELEANRLNGKTFILDTDFLLYSLTSHCKKSKQYRKLLRTLRNLKCNLIIPDEVVQEVLIHAQLATGHYYRFKNTLEAVDASVIEQTANNVFVKDYCLYKLSIPNDHHKSTIKQFMYNRYLSDDDPLTFIKQVIRDELRIEPGGDLVIDIDLKEHEDGLAERIYQKDKDEWREEKEKRSIATADAKLYLAVLTLNKDITSNLSGMLRANAYLVTHTTKSIKSASEMGISRNFVTRPELIINLLSEIGEFESSSKDFISLFDNPFLAYIVEDKWQLIRNLSETGLDLHDKSITRLEKDLGEVYHKYITNDAQEDNIETDTRFNNVTLFSPEKFIEFADAVNSKNYRFMPEAQGLINKFKELNEQKESAERKQESAEQLLAQKARGYKAYLEKTHETKNRPSPENVSKMIKQKRKKGEKKKKHGKKNRH